MERKKSTKNTSNGKWRQLTRRPIFAASLIVLAFVIVLSSVVTAFFSQTLGNVRRLDPDKEKGKDLIDYHNVPEPSLVHPVTYDKEITNILLLGIDSRDPDSVRERSDSMIILTVNRRQNKLKLTSLQRDMLVYIPGKERPDKLTHANVYGGPELTMRVINETLRLSIDRYAIINIHHMENLIDAIGGVTLDVTPEMFPYVNFIIEKTNRELDFTDPVPTLAKSGRQHLNGRQAVSFARDRSTAAGDYDRMGYQQELLQALFDRFHEISSGEMMDLMSTGLSMLTTNLTNNEIIGLVQSVLPMMDDEIERLTLPVEGYNRHYSGLAWVNLCDFNGMIPIVQQFMYGQTYPFDPVPEIPGAPNSSKDISELTNPHNDVTLPPEYNDDPVAPPVEPDVKPSAPATEEPTATSATTSISSTPKPTTAAPSTTTSAAPPESSVPKSTSSEPTVTEPEVTVTEPTTPEVPEEPTPSSPPDATGSPAEPPNEVPAPSVEGEQP